MDMCAMEPQLANSGSSSSLSNVLGNDTTKPLISAEAADSEKRVQFSSSRSLSESLSSPRTSQGTLKKSSKSKKDTYRECQRKELLVLMKKNNTQDIMCFFHPDVNVSDEEGRTPLILAIQNNNNTVINDLLLRKDIDVNMADKWGNTPLHHAALQHNSVIIKSLLDDPRVNSLITNEDGTRAHQFLDKQFHQDFLALRSLFFVRSRLESVVDKTIPSLQKQLKGSALDDAVNEIKKRIADDAGKQGDEPLPEKVQLPINDILIKQIIICRWVKQGIPTVHDTELGKNVSSVKK